MYSNIGNKPPGTAKALRKFLGMVQLYCHLWEKWSHLIAPLTDLIGECGMIKTTRKNKTRKKKFIGLVHIRRLLKPSNIP